MKKFNCVLLLVFGLSQIFPVFSQDHFFDTDRADWWNEEWIPAYQIKSTALDMDFIRVKKNKLVNENDEILVFKGLSIADPDKIVKDGRWSKAHFEVIKSWGATLVRIPVHPFALRQRGIKNYLKLLDQAVDWCSELGIYVIIDWHSIGNLQMEMFQHDIYETTKRETYYFWKTIARHYKDIPTVAFYEIYNEPTVFNGTLGSCTWEEWKKIAEDIIDIIYAHDNKVIPLVGGFNWAYDLRNMEYNPIARPGVAYVTHPYPGKCEPPRENHWEEHFGFLTERYPILATELGYFFEGEEHLIEDGTYREAIVNYFEQKGISWCAWVFDPNWVPQMIKNYDYEPTHQGAFFKEVMLGNYKFRE
ncbi:MAG: cellulase family glycosylhydrolase [Saprospiraceae bacterium]|nr:cellulase family glycosylhydrolase [Saprospiraceae bacterium]